ncbi:acyl-CoA dehydrogenase family protein [Jatrophihabitans sp.]|uniref:acyl-CoA dehydrogenase family protein n=1 Tax=Jatrophihabitans sp. TaxID=1932789 RepID=UPI002C2A39D7|nr:acyl-CoA dehydrogenase family protein [Jatrophihabitans sp.]
MATHQVFNVPEPWAGVNLFDSDRALTAALAAAGVNAGRLAGLSELGRLAGTAEAQEWARLANEYPPVLRSHDRYGHRIDEVEFHPAWHELMRVAVGAGLHAAPWVTAGPNPHLARAAGFYVWAQLEQGHGCPISMTYAALPTLRHSRELSAVYRDGLTSLDYDPGLRAPADKAGLLAGMAMTEKQGGSDVRANTTRAVRTSDGSYAITGHKWFCSAPMCDLFLVLAQAEAGLSCFLVPRVLPDGSRNPFALQRLKSKLGNRSNASSEVEFDGTTGWLVGDEGRGVHTILKMVTMTRLDCVIGSAALQRAALTQALHHVGGRDAFGARLADQPLMQEVTADLAVEVQAATALFLRLASAVDSAELPLLRLAVAAAKYWVCKRTPTVVGEALECLGGAGYVEESPLPRYFRESPLNSIWEGSGNVLALDVVRTATREPEAVQALQDELALTAGADPRLDAATDRLARQLAALGADPDADARSARELAGLLARTLQAGLLVRAANRPGADPGSSAVAEAFLASRLAAEGGYGGHAGAGLGRAGCVAVLDYTAQSARNST